MFLSVGLSSRFFRGVSRALGFAFEVICLNLKSERILLRNLSKSGFIGLLAYWLAQGSWLLILSLCRPTVQRAPSN